MANGYGENRKKILDVVLRNNGKVLIESGR